MIAVDWGTSNFRAFRLGAGGAILARHSSSQGILSVAKGGFAEVLRAEVGEWIDLGEQRILLCGMIGSRQGWVEAPYLACPAGLAELAGSLISVPFEDAEVRLVPGVSGRDPQGIPEMMRGEETQAVGLLESGVGGGLVCFPGTHTKWVHIRDGRIVDFITSMTGEVYGALREHTILGRAMSSKGTADSEAFLQGVERSADSGGLLHHLFGVRTLGLVDQLKEDSTASYLSGLLIGHEVRAAMLSPADVHVVGAAALCSLYRQAIGSCGGTATVETEDAAAHGLAAIGRKLQWI